MKVPTELVICWVVWFDAHICHGDLALDDVDPKSKGLIQITAGILVKEPDFENDNVVIIAQSYDKVNEQFGQYLEIPCPWVLEIKRESSLKIKDLETFLKEKL